MLPSETDLRYFHAVATDLNFSRTARKLNVSQPALSIAIKRLETILSMQLFIRHTQGLNLTRAGTHLFAKVDKLLLQWSQLVEEMKELTGSIKGQVTIGCHSTLSPFMSTMVAQLLTQHPGLEIHFKHGFTPEIMQDIVEGTLDIGITTDPFPHASVVIQPIAETEFTFWISSRQDAIDLQANELLIICDTQIAPTQYLLNELQKLRGHQTGIRLSNINQIEAIAAMTVESQGISILPTAYTEYYFSKQLQKIPGAPVYKKPLCLVFRPESKAITSIQTVLNAIKDIVKQK